MQAEVRLLECTNTLSSRQTCAGIQRNGELQYQPFEVSEARWTGAGKRKLTSHNISL